MQSELRGIDIWKQEKAFSLDISFFKKHNKNKSKKRKASAVENDNNTDIAADRSASPPIALPRRLKRLQLELAVQAMSCRLRTR